MCAALLLTTQLAMPVYADEPYDVYNYDRYGEAVPSQAGYLADRSVSGEDLGTTLFQEPTDIFRDFNDLFYVVDGGGNRIVAIDTEWTEVVKIYDSFTMPDGSQTTLAKPNGMYISPYSQLMYIADTDNSRVLVSDLDGNVQLEIGMPDEASFDSETFLPQKVLADKAGNIYVVLNNITNGAMVFDQNGEFSSYYGANRVETTAEVLANYFWTSIATEEMRARRTRETSAPFSNFDVDEKGFIYTSMESTTQDLDKIKKLNAAGNNLFSNYEITIGDNDLWVAETNTSYETHIVDIEIGDDNTINCLDMTTGRVFQYDEECNLLFIVGTKAEQVGGFRLATALESMGEHLYVLDKSKGTVTIFTETEFGSLVHEANSLYNDGYYEEALDPWYEVLKRDGNYRRAYIGIASALLNKGEYQESMKYAKLAVAPMRYDKAFEGWRSEFLSKYFNMIIAGVAVLAVGGFGLSFWRKRKKKQEGGNAS